jgi:hypothetical protein
VRCTRQFDAILFWAERSCGSFALMSAGELPGGLEVEKPYSLEGVFDWYQDCPQQIERVVIASNSYFRPRKDRCPI